MDFIQTILEYLASAARALWTGVLGALALGWAGASILAFPGLVVGAGLGAIAGTWAGDRLGIVPIRRMTGLRANDSLIQAFGAFLVVAVGYWLYKMAFLLLAIVALAIIASWFLG